MSQVVWIPADDGDRPVLIQPFPTVPAISGVAVIVVNKATDSTVSTTSGTASQSAQDNTLWLYDTTDITGVNLETVGFAQLAVRFRASLTAGGEIDRWQELTINGARAEISTIKDLVLVSNAWSKDNVVWENQKYEYTYQGVDYLTSADCWAYDSKTNADLHDKVTGLLETLHLSATYTNGKNDFMKMTRDP